MIKRVCLGQISGEIFTYIKMGDGKLGTTHNYYEASNWDMVSLEKLNSGDYAKIKKIIEAMCGVELFWLPICMNEV